MIDHSTYKLGKLAPSRDPRIPKLKNYLTAVALPPVPASVDWYSSIPANAWPMDDNDTVGDCTIAAAAHQIQTWTTYEGDPAILPSATVLSVYETLSGYNGTPATDVGCVEVNVLDYWKSTGIGGHTISAFAALDVTNINEVKLALSLFGGIYIGVQLPISAQGQTTWDVAPAPNGIAGSWGGHAIPILGYTAEGLTFVSWGAIYQMTWAFWSAYVDEAYAIISQDFLNTSNVDPAGVSLTTLQADLATLGIATPPGPSSAIVSLLDGINVDGVAAALIAPNLIFAANLTAGPVELTGVGGSGTANTITEIKYTQNYALGLLKMPVTDSGYLGYLPNWSGGPGIIACSTGGMWYASQTFTPSGATSSLVSSLNGLVLAQIDGVTDIVGTMSSTTQAYLLTDTDIATIESWILTLSGNAPACARLYQTVLGREPDAAGLTYWSSVYAATATALNTTNAAQVMAENNYQLVHYFTDSSEFAAINSGYTATDPTAWVTYLYGTALNRAPDASGLAYWVAAINAGTVTRDQIVISFCESGEAIGYLTALAEG
jgi:hypothetical protein